jgi:hypothetical protein
MGSVEEDRLKDDVKKMFSGMLRQARSIESEDEDGDLENEVTEATRELMEIVQGIFQATMTTESLRKIAEEKGITQRIGQVGLKNAIENIQEKVADALNPDNF